MALTKPRILDVMPNTSGLLALMHDFSLERKETSNDLIIRFANVRKIDAIGLAILLGLFCLGKESLKNYEFRIVWSDYVSVNSFLKSVDLIANIEKMGAMEKKSVSVGLFDDVDGDSTGTQNTIDKFSENAQEDIQKIIIFRPELYEVRQEALNTFSRELKDFMALNEPRVFNHEQIIKVFLELAKNTFDHSSGIGIAGLYIQKRDGKHNIQFVYCDTGEGICLNVRNYCKNILRSDQSISIEERQELVRLANKGGTSDFLHKALQAGFSTKHGNGVNHGMGLTLITQGAIGCGFKGLLHDANSIIDLTGMVEPYSHSRLRLKTSRTAASKLQLLLFEKETQSDTAT